MSPLSYLAFLLVLHQAPLSPSQGSEALGQPGQRWTLHADERRAEGEVFVAVGNAVLATDTWTIRAEQLVYNQRTRTAEATGNVLVIGALGASFAEHVSIDLATETAILDDAVFLQKDGVSPADLAQAKSPDELKRLGATRLVLSGDSVERTGPRSLRVRGLAFTPCDCDLNRPSWRIRAWSAEVTPGKRASLWFPVVEILDVPLIERLPVFAWPYLNLPLKNRATGVLIPRPNYQTQNGFSFELPFFVTLGDSYDVTFTPGYFSGSPDRKRAFGIKGPRLNTEFRYRPSETTTGRLSVGVLHDQRLLRDPRREWLTLQGKTRGVRGDLRLEHASEWGGLTQRADLSLVSDGYMTRDLTTDVVQQAIPYLRSTASVSWRRPDTYVGLHTVLRQDLRFGYSLFGENRGLIPRPPDELLPGQTRVHEAQEGLRAPRPFHELPSLHLFLPQRRIAGPLRAGGHVAFTRIGPLVGRHGDEGADGIWRGDYLEGEGDGEFQHRGPTGLLLESEARDRLSLRPFLAAPVSIGPLRISPYGWYRGDFWYGEVTGERSTRHYLLGGLRLSTEVARRWGDRVEGLRHTVSPEVELRAVPFVAGQGVERPYDAIDAAIPQRSFTEGVVQLRQGLWRRHGGIDAPLLRLDVGQGYDFSEERLAESFARLQLFYGGAGVSGVVRYQPNTRQVSSLTANGFWSLTPRHHLGLAYDELISYLPGSLEPYGSELQHRFLDRLIGQQPPPLPDRAPGSDAPVVDRLRLASASLSGRIYGAWSAAYTVVLQPGAQYPKEIRENTGAKLTPFQSHNVTATFAPACHCWNIGVYARWQRNPFPSQPESGKFTGPDFGAIVQISGFGTLGTPEG